MSSEAADLAHRLARHAEAVCRYYLSNGRRQGRYWLVGDVANTPGRSLYVRLKGPDSGKGAAGKWTDSATGQHGDLLDLIAINRGLPCFRDVLDEARSFLSLPRPKRRIRKQLPAVPTGWPESARRLFAAAQPIPGTLAERYLRRRGITAVHGLGALRFHARCYYRPDDNGPTETWPALIAAVTDLSGMITGAHRTWLDPSGRHKAPLETPRRAMGYLLGNGVRFGIAQEVMAAGEGIETILSLRSAIPTMPMVAALSANHLAALLLPATLRRLYVARDRDSAGDAVMAALTDRAQVSGIEPIGLLPTCGDFNEDLQQLGIDDLRAALRVQLLPEDVAQFMTSTKEDDMSG
jgi:hypothetical protein